jgi:hypothetical protein
MGLFFEVRFDFVALGRSREIGCGLQSQSPWVFLVDPNDNERALRLVNGRPLSLASVFSPRSVQAFSLNPSVATKRATRKNKILQSPTKSHAFFDNSRLSLASPRVT